MKTCTIRSVCECEAKLIAELDEHKHVIRGTAKDMRRGKEEPAPAHSMNADEQVFQVGWFCPFCIRNTLRSFETGGLMWKITPDAPAETKQSA